MCCMCENVFCQRYGMYLFRLFMDLSTAGEAFGTI